MSTEERAGLYRRASAANRLFSDQQFLGERIMISLKNPCICCAFCILGLAFQTDLVVGQTKSSAVSSPNQLQDPGPGGANTGRQERDGQHDFDFWPGTWKIHNRRLMHPLTGSTTWVEFESRSVAKMVWDGRANLDEYEGDSPSGHIEGLTVRLYNSKSHQWSLYWANQANGTMETPTIGEFKNGRGDFYDREFFQGRSIYVRYSWLNIKPNSCRWEQAFSEDGGKTWENNWVMEMTRVDR
jgi:hypothetical protein